ncbi:MAG: hypothetical protein WC736_14620 [Gallionella sp.]|jgi:hypothetical protein
MAEHDFEWFLSHADAFESLTVDQVNALSRGELVEYGDTAPAAPAGDEPAAAATAAEGSATPAAAAEPEPEPAVLAKDGKHTIPFSELETARAKADQFEALANTQAELIANLKAAKAADAGTGDTAAQEDVLKEFKEQYPDMAAVLAPALQKAIDAGVAVKVADLKRELTASIDSDADTKAHFAAITNKVPDFEALVESGEVDKWIKTLPTLERRGAEIVMKEGTAPEIIELFTQYKATLGKPADQPPALTKAELEAKAADAIAKAKGTKLTSASDIPASQVGTVNTEPTTAAEWSQKFATMSPEAIMKML